jgi:hypothetical protein
MGTCIFYIVISVCWSSFVAKSIDPYGDFYDPEADEDAVDIRKYRQTLIDSKRRAAVRDELNEVGRVEKITPENLERREFYEDHYVEAHQELFQRSTGIKPFGITQVESINRTLHTIKHGGRSVIAEPRGFGKTSRTANNALMAILQGKIRYALILASSVQKAEDILESIKTELVDNQELYQLYPEICECFRHVSDSPTRAIRQTYMGEKTHIGWTKGMLRMPILPGIKCGGSIIQVRSKDNVRGLNVKIRYGEESGTILRPDFVFMDDIQTDEEAESPTSVWKIVQTIKKSILFSGTHMRPISAVMCCTPICPGDVSSHFILNEPSWDVIVSPMIIKYPDNYDMWLNQYASIITDFDRYATGARLEARLRGRKFVEDNYEALHKGAEWSWDWAYAWGEDPQTEISALQHAMNFKIDEGDEAFESECQCNVAPRIDEAAGIRCTLDEVMNKVHRWPRNKCPVESKFITTHIDLNREVLTYVTVASPKEFRPMIIDYGTWPDQKGMTWRKRDIVYSLKKQYPDIPEEHERRYQGVRDLINYIGNKTYLRDDNLVMQNNLIMVDMRYSIDEVQRAIRDSNFRNITCCYAGQGISAKTKQFMDRHYTKESEKHFHCATVPTDDRTLTVLYTDVNYFKTSFHKGIKTRPDICGSVSLFEHERPGGHMLFAKQCLVEVPEEDYNEKENLRVLIWSNPKDEDNEAFDNIVGCQAGLFKLGCEIRMKREKKGTYNMQDYINSQKD